MTKRLASTVIITDEQAEGLPEARKRHEPADPQQTMTLRALQPEVMIDDPIAETGLMRAVVVAKEGDDNNDRQDAGLTTAETQNPAAATPQTAAPAHDSALQPTNGTTTPSVLIIEDTMELAEMLQLTLKRLNLETAHESHGNKAFARYNELNPDVVLLDIGLPDITGWKVLDSIKERQKETGGKMPAVIVITAYGDATNRLVGKLHGVYSYLVKPFTSDDVENVVKSALSQTA
ncbi:MAG: response regulator [Chloroflexi bacterium]|nr:response regulator [Chloroflexota bacterium]